MWALGQGYWDRGAEAGREGLTGTARGKRAECRLGKLSMLWDVLAPWSIAWVFIHVIGIQSSKVGGF